MIAFWRSILTSKFVWGAAAILALLAGIWLYGVRQYHQGVTDTETAVKLAAAAKYRSQVQDLNRANTQLQTTVDALKNEQPKIVTKYRDRIIKVPLPADCVADDGRLHDLQRAAESTNAARESGRKMP